MSNARFELAQMLVDAERRTHVLFGHLAERSWPDCLRLNRANAATPAAF
jgi:hypothetical protein